MNVTNFAKSIIAGSCGSVTHLCFMWFKSWSGILPSFQPYDDLQHMLSVLVGSPVHPDRAMGSIVFEWGSRAWIFVWPDV